MSPIVIDPFLIDRPPQAARIDKSSLHSRLLERAIEHTQKRPFRHAHPVGTSPRSGAVDALLTRTEDIGQFERTRDPPPRRSRPTRTPLEELSRMTIGLSELRLYLEKCRYSCISEG